MHHQRVITTASAAGETDLLDLGITHSTDQDLAFLTGTGLDHMDNPKDHTNS